MLRAIALLTVALAAVAPARGQHDEHAATPAAEKLGTVSFANSCAREVSTGLTRAVALLHSFEFRSAIDGFETVLARDADCAVSYWGIALSYWGNPFAGARSTAALDAGVAAIDRGRATGKPTARERAYAAAERISWEGVHYRRDIGARQRSR